MNKIYEPQEDSFLLKKYVEKYSFGKVLDMGTGSGILALAAFRNKKVKSVTAGDIEDVKICFKNTKIKFVKTDLFKNIKGKFDTIIFNPPYLPEDDYDDLKSTTGGKKGWEIIAKFLKQSKKHLNKKGIILMVFSSLTNRKKTDELVKKNHFRKELLEEKGLFMERLYVYLLK